MLLLLSWNMLYCLLTTSSTQSTIHRALGSTAHVCISDFFSSNLSTQDSSVPEWHPVLAFEKQHKASSSESCPIEASRSRNKMSHYLFLSWFAMKLIAMKQNMFLCWRRKSKGAGTYHQILCTMDKWAEKFS